MKVSYAIASSLQMPRIRLSAPRIVYWSDVGDCIKRVLGALAEFCENTQPTDDQTLMAIWVLGCAGCEQLSKVVGSVHDLPRQFELAFDGIQLRAVF